MRSTEPDEAPPAALRPQRGGSPSVGSILYRDADVDRLHECLAAGESIVLTAEKRVGKTAVLELLRDRSADDLLIIKRDVEGVGSPKRLVELLCEDIRPYLSSADKAKEWFATFTSKLGGAEVGPITLPDFELKDWQTHLNELFDALADHLAKNGGAVAILWDEAPWMIAKVERDCGWETAADLLDELRHVRGRHPSIRFLFTGSVGFHHVLRALRNGLSHRASINDLRVEQLPPLTHGDATKLAWALLRWVEDRGTPCADDLPDVAAHVAEVCEGIPWFIHATVDDLRKRGAPISTGAVDEVVQAARFEAADGWELRHYIDRLDEYYGDDAATAAHVLDAIAAKERATPDEILLDLAHHGTPPTKDDLRDLLRLLQEDHYLAHEAPTWAFTYQLIRHAWLDIRDIGSDQT